MSNPNYRSRAEMLTACRNKYLATMQRISDAATASRDLAGDAEVQKLLEILAIGIEEQFLEDIVRMDFAMARGVELQSSMRAVA